MTEADAWREVGRRLERRGRLKVPGTGLCFEMEQVDPKWSYHNPRIKKHLGRRREYAYEGDEWEARCFAAYWLALECDAEVSNG